MLSFNRIRNDTYWTKKTKQTEDEYTTKTIRERVSRAYAYITLACAKVVNERRLNMLVH